MKDDSGSIRTIIQEQGGGAVAAAGERGAGDAAVAGRQAVVLAASCER